MINVKNIKIRKRFAREIVEGYYEHFIIINNIITENSKHFVKHNNEVNPK